jgi:acetate---CoA ligase (ADP-forming)
VPVSHVPDTISPTVASPSVDLARLYRPRTVAIVGAHDTRAPLNSQTERVLDRARLVGARVYLVNPRKAEVFGERTYGSIADVPESVDLLVILIGDPASVLQEAVAAAPAFTIIFAAGFSEVGADGAERERKLAAAGKQAHTRIIGPNTNINTLELLQDLPAPKVAVATQSGMQGRPIAQAQDIGMALSYWATTGNEVDLGVCDFMEYFAYDGSTGAIAAYVEGFTSGQRLRDAALAALETGTPIVLIKAGRTEHGAQTAASHTGHLTGSDAAFDAFADQFGVTRVEDLDELIEVSWGLAKSPLPPVSGVAVSSPSGGTCVHLTDLVVQSGLSMPTLSQETQEKLRKYIPDVYAVSNPVDNGGITFHSGYGPDIIETTLSDPAIGLLIFGIPGVFPLLAEPIAEALLRARKNSTKPIFVVWGGPTINDPSHRAIVDGGIPIFRNLRNAIRAAQALVDWAARRPQVAEFAASVRALPALTDTRVVAAEQLDEGESADWLSARGISFAPYRAVSTVAEAADAARELGFPCVLKARGRDLAHKSEQKLVELGLQDPHDVVRAAEAIQGRQTQPIEGWLVARQLTGIELILGMSTDPVLGPSILVGAGGIAAEAAPDVALSVLPVDRARARAMLSSLRIASLLDGWRGSPPVDKEAIVDSIMALAAVAESGEATEIDINPLIVSPSGAQGADALVRVRGV